MSPRMTRKRPPARSAGHGRRRARDIGLATGREAIQERSSRAMPSRPPRRARWRRRPPSMPTAAEAILARQRHRTEPGGDARRLAELRRHPEAHRRAGVDDERERSGASSAVRRTSSSPCGRTPPTPRGADRRRRHRGACRSPRRRPARRVRRRPRRRASATRRARSDRRPEARGHLRREQRRVGRERRILGDSEIEGNGGVHDHPQRWKRSPGPRSCRRRAPALRPRSAARWCRRTEGATAFTSSMASAARPSTSSARARPRPRAPAPRAAARAAAHALVRVRGQHGARAAEAVDVPGREDRAHRRLHLEGSLQEGAGRRRLRPPRRAIRSATASRESGIFTQELHEEAIELRLRQREDALHPIGFSVASTKNGDGSSLPRPLDRRGALGHRSSSALWVWAWRG